MHATDLLVATIEVKVKGTPLPEVALGKLATATVDQSIHLPASCTLVFVDSGEGAGSQDPLHFGLLDADLLPIGASVEVLLGYGRDVKAVFKGEVVAHDLEVEDEQPPLFVVRCYDRGHRLQRGRASRTWLHMTDADIVGKVASTAGLKARCDATPMVYPYVLQNNQTAWEFLHQRAARIGYELYVDDDTLWFRKPAVNDAADQELVLWQDLLRVHLHLTSTRQAGAVAVRAWDSDTQQPILGERTAETATGRGGAQKSGPRLAAPFAPSGGKTEIQVTSQPVANQAEADTLAQATLDDLAQGSLVLEAEARGNPGLHAGQVITLQGMGTRFSGSYYVTGARHHYGGRRGYTTEISVGGRRNGTLLELVGGAARGQGHGASSAIALGVVSANKGPDSLGRVKVQLPWLGDKVETDWIRVATPGGGKERGFFWLPEVGDEVVVAFEHGDPQRAYVVGSLWNAKADPPMASTQVVSPDGLVNQRVIKSRSGHTITLDDTSGQEKITVADKTGGNVITIETASNKITISARGDLELKAQANVKLSGAQVSIEAQGACEVKGVQTKVSGAVVAVEAEGECSVKGGVISLN